MCAHCLRAQPACICRWVAALAPTVELLILQHPLEVDNAKNSARLLQLSVASSVMVTGEAFAPGALAALLDAGGRTPVLLYPDTAGEPATVPAPGVLAVPGNLRLVILDATWRKSRKMLHLNPALQRLPRYTLRAMPPSHYRIRKAHAPDQLSTLEAAAYAVMQLENSIDVQPLLAAFDGFVGQRLDFIPPGLSHRHA